MIGARFQSFATVLGVAALSLTAMFGGASLLRLSLADDAQAFRRLVDDPVVGAAASLDLALVEAEPEARARALEMSLARAPLHAGAWLDLAIARRAAGAEFDRVVEALSLSVSTGPREARLLAGRVAFALPFWALLPGKLKSRLIGDLAGVAPYLEPRQRDQIAALVRLQAPEDAAPICLELRERAIRGAAAFGCPPGRAP